MKTAFRTAMDVLYFVCIAISGIALVVITLVMPWGVFTRYVLGTGSAWPEPMSVLMMIVFTFLAAAACYRAKVHLSVAMFVDALPGHLQSAARVLIETLMALLAIFTLIWGVRLCVATWPQAIAEFPFLSVGLTYVPIPLGGAITLLFIIERLWIGPPSPDSFVFRQPASTD